MNWNVAVLCLVFVLFLSGCSIQYGNSQQTVSETDTIAGDTNLADSETDAPQNKSATQNKYIANGRGFAALVENILNKRGSTGFVTSSASPDNTVNLTIQVNRNTPLYRTLMDGAQAVAAVTFYSTKDVDQLPRVNGTIERLHQPELVTIDVLNRNGTVIGTYQIDPDKARAYRSNERSANKFSIDIISSYQATEFHKRGSQKPSDYLNQSELSLFAHDYATEIRNWTRNGFDSKFPIDSIRTSPRTNNMLHQFEWSRGKYGEVVDSAYASAYTAYWRTIRRSWAKTPERLYVYIERPNKNENFAAYMNRRDAYILLESNLDVVNRSAYLERDVGGFIDTDDNPYRDIFYASSESNATDD